MKGLSEYNIQFVGLKQGTHFYEFNVDNSFFEEFDCLDYDKAMFKVDLEFIKQSTMMRLNFNFAGTILVPCDRCLNEVEIPVEGEGNLVIKFGQSKFEETDEILVLPENEFEINIASYIYEYISVHIPRKRVHTESECDADVLKKLNKLEEKKETEIDPRWSGLKDFNTEK